MCDKIFSKTHKRKVLYDHNGTNDDFIGLLLLLSAENIELLGVTVTPAGCLVSDGVEATLKILTFCGKVAIPVAKGTIQGPNPFPYEIRASPKVICALPQLIHLTLNKRQLTEESAEDLIIRRIKETQGPITMVITGPPSNFVAALQKAPEITDRIEEVVLMGGCIDVEGNVFQYNHDGSAEWNFYWDPESSKRLIASGLKITMFTLDIMNTLPSDLSLLKQLAKQRDFDLSDLACQIWAPTLAVQSGKFQHLFNDVLGVAYLICDDLAAFRKLELEVRTQAPSEGRLTKVPGNNCWVSVAEEINVENYKNSYLKALKKNINRPDLSKYSTIRKRKVFYDHDGGYDDILSLQLVLSMENIELLGICVTPADCLLEDALEATLKVLSLFKQTTIPVAKGTTYGPNPFPYRWRSSLKGVNGMPLLINQRMHKNQIVQESGVELMIKLIKGSQEPVTVLLTGPCTNLAAALEKDPEIKKNIEEVVLMGGAVDVRGNVFQYNHDASAEWNIYYDPEAAKRVFSSGLEVTIFSLDSTNNVPVNLDFLRKLAGQKEFSSSYLASQIWAPTVKSIPSADYMYFMWDTLATAYLGCDKLCTFKRIELDVITQPPSEGKTCRKPGNGNFVNVADIVNVDGFYRYYLALLRKDLFIDEEE